MHTIAAFYTGANGVSAVYSQLNAVLDQSLPQDGANRFLMPSDYTVIAAYGLGLRLTALRINTPSLRNFILPEIYPVTQAVAPATTDSPTFYQNRGPSLKMNEGLELDYSSTSGAADLIWGALWIAPRIIAAPAGPVFTALATTTITAVSGSWVLGILTFNQALPVGKYAVVGMACVAANTVLARLVFTGENNFRPGCMVQKTYGSQYIEDWFRYGGMGLFGYFTNTTLPQLEILGDAAGAAAPTVYLDLVKVG